MTPPARSRLPRRLCRVLFVLLVPLLGIELVLRVAGPRISTFETLLYDPRGVTKYHQAQSLEELLELSVLGFKPRSLRLDYVLNSKSLHTIEYTEEKPPNTFRVLVLGNSFVFTSGGIPHDRIWHDTLRRALEERTDLDVEMLNFGVPAVGLEFQQRLWELEGMKLDADLVIATFTVGGSFHASRNSMLERTAADNLAVRWHTFRFVRNALRLRAARPAGGWKQAGGEQHSRRKIEIPAGVGGVPVATFAPDFEPRYSIDQPAMSDRKFVRTQWRILNTSAGLYMDDEFESAGKTLMRFAEHVQNSGPEFLFLLIPAEVQSNPELRAGVHIRRGRERTAHESALEGDIEKPQRFFAELCAREDIRYLDLLPHQKEASRSSKLYGPNDTHWNLAGNDLAAQVLVEVLTTTPTTGEPWAWQAIWR